MYEDTQEAKGDRRKSISDSSIGYNDLYEISQRKGLGVYGTGRNGSKDMKINLNKGKVMKNWAIVKKHLVDTGDIYQDSHIIHAESILAWWKPEDPVIPVYQPTSSDEFINRKLFEKSLTAAHIQKKKQQDLESQVKNEIISETSEQRMKRFTRAYRKSQNMEITPQPSDTSCSSSLRSSSSSSSTLSASPQFNVAKSIKKWAGIELKTVIIPLEGVARQCNCI
ncbi:HGL221Wp [Eremothecium sinecaudum]|uniref:HGL221Wp n=1 Tax=Eremothecium sinecaudum TaxID=45286 RepID=A0A0X8HVD0_9SACH|nr:HGL221Wp [Eremothecium sinecaudum]AMD22119.1 HGL221Wp [Eremothecium sinecaudum]